MSLQLNELSNVLKKEMSRKEFLKVVGAGVLGAIGVTGAIQSILKLNGTTTTVNNKTVVKEVSGYGKSAYGR